MEGNSLQKNEPLVEEKRTLENYGTSLFHQLVASKKETKAEDVKILLQRMIVIARVPRDPTVRAELGAHYEKLNFQLSRQYMWDNMTGLLLIYPSYLLHVIESSRELIVSVLRDLVDLQQQSDSPMVEVSKVVLMAHDLPSRMFQQWSFKVLKDRGSNKQPEEEDDEPLESLLLALLSGLKNLSEHIETAKKTDPGTVMVDCPELFISQDIVANLLTQEDLQTLQQYLKSYDSPLHIRMDFGQMKRSGRLTSV